MTADLHTAFYSKASANPGFAGVMPVGDAFQRALDHRIAKCVGFYGRSASTADGRATRRTFGGTTTCMPASMAPI